MRIESFWKLSDKQFQQVDVAADVFEEAFSTGGAVNIEDHLAEIPEDLRETLLQEILTIELQLRHKRGELPESAEYEARCPALKDSIRSVFLAVYQEEVDRARRMANTDLPTHAIAASGMDALPTRDEESGLLPKGQPHVTAKFGRYELIRIIGNGGMGAVYLARDPQLDRSVAVKIPNHWCNRSGASDAVARFYREARAMAAVHHPNLCPIYDVGESVGQPYLTMAYINGRTLSCCLRDEHLALAPHETAAMIQTLARAVQAAHDVGIVHRDLKPSNVMINQHGEPVVMDFGLAWLDEDEAEATRSGVMIGSPAYMAPEQVRAEHDQIGPQTDVHALGVIMYELLCNRRPFEGSAALVLEQISAGAAPAPPSRFADVPPDLETVCLKAMAHNVEDRFPTAADLAVALEPFCEEEAGVERRAGVASRSRQTRMAKTGRGRIWLTWACFALLCLGAAAAALVFRIGTPSGELVVRAAEGTDVEIEVQQNGKIIDILSKDDGWRVRVEEGRYNLVLRSADRELSLDGDAVTVTRRGKVEVTVVRKPGKAARPKAPTPDQPPSIATPTARSSGRFYDSGQRLGNSPSVGVCLGDVNGDGALDALVFGRESANRVWLNDGKGVFRDSGQEFGNWGGALGDLDGDGDLDAVVHLFSGNRIWINDGEGVFREDEQTLSSGVVVRLGDLDGDDDLDLVIVKFKADCRIWRNDGHGRFEDLGQPVPNPTNIMDLVVGDVDGDRDLDIVLVRQHDVRESVWLNIGQVRFRQGNQSLGRGSGNTCVLLGDLDLDGDSDAVVTSFHTILRRGDAVWWNDGSGVFSQHHQLIGSSQCWHASLGDLDGDGDLDIVVDDQSVPSMVQLNDGHGSFVNSGHPVGTNQSQFTALGDLDGDGDLDAFLANDTGELANQIWLNEDRDDDLP